MMFTGKQDVEPQRKYIDQSLKCWTAKSRVLRHNLGRIRVVSDLRNHPIKSTLLVNEWI